MLLQNFDKNENDQHSKTRLLQYFYKTLTKMKPDKIPKQDFYNAFTKRVQQ